MDSVSVENLSIKFGEEILFDNVHFTIPAGEFVTLTGGSGTGKTTLLQSLMGFVPNVTGTIKIFDQPLQQKYIQQIRSKIAWIPQEINLPVETTKDLFYLPFTFRYNKHLRPAEEETEEILQAFGLSVSIFNKAVNEISGGQKQRIVLASCILLKKPLLLLDEPTAALDENSIHLVMEYMRSLQDTTIISVSHNQEWIEHSDRLIKMNEL